MQKEKGPQLKTKKIRWTTITKKLILIFDALLFASLLLFGFITQKFSEKAVIEKIDDYLNDKAIDTAMIVDQQIDLTFQTFTVLADSDILRDTTVPLQKKIEFLDRRTKENPTVLLYTFTSPEGISRLIDGRTLNLSDRKWFKEAMKGVNFVEEPFVSRVDGSFVMTFAVPVYDYQKNIVGILTANVDGLTLAKYVENIVIGKTGYVYILDKEGTDIADKDYEWVRKQQNSTRMAKTDSSLETVAIFEQMALKSNKSDIGFYTYQKIKYICSFSHMKRNGWVLVIMAPVNEFMQTIGILRNWLIGLGIGIIIAGLLFVAFFSIRLTKPIKKIVTALKNIAQGDGDLTVKLPLQGNDEITDLARYFNKTIQKIGFAFAKILAGTTKMGKIGVNLSSNMSETASSINEISANIDGVKQQVISQSTGVTETSATMEEIIRTINQLNAGIENQTNSIKTLIEIIQKSERTTEKTKKILNRNDELIAQLVEESTEGKNVITASSSEVKRIAEESGSLLEASSIIENIASQTNLLAMNAAIEAAHAGDSGKGFAVVADEIRKLAEESSAQAKIITVALKNLSLEIENVAKSSKDIDGTFTSMFSKVKDVNKMSEEIMNIAKERKEQSDQLLTLIEDVTMVTNEVKDGSSEMLRGGEQVATEMRKLDELTRIITNSMDEMAAGATQINNAVQEVSNMTQDNKSSIDSLAVEVNKFKI